MIDSVAYPEDDLFGAVAWPGSDQLATADLTGRALACVIRSPAILQRILFFVQPERVMLLRLQPGNRRMLRRDIKEARVRLQHCKFTYTVAGLPVTLMCGPPGSWAELLPMMKLSEQERAHSGFCFLHQPEGFAAMACIVSKGGSAVRTLRVAIESSGPDHRAAAAVGAAALLFSIVAHNRLSQLNSLTVVDAGGGWLPSPLSFFAPFARTSAKPLEKLRTLRLVLVGSNAPSHLDCLAQYAWRGGLRSLRSLTIEGQNVQDVDISQFLRAIIGAQHLETQQHAQIEPALSQTKITCSRENCDKASGSSAICTPSNQPSCEPNSGGAEEQSIDPNGSCSSALSALAEPCSAGVELAPFNLTSIDFRGSLAGAITLSVLLDLLAQLRKATGPRNLDWRKVSVQLHDTPAATSPECESLFNKLANALPRS